MSSTHTPKSFDPAEDSPTSASQRRVKETYEALLSAGEEADAAELRGLDTFSEQRELAIQLRRKHWLTV